MSRPIRSKIAQETVAICETGTYRSANGHEVDIREDIRNSIENTVLYSLETLSAPTGHQSGQPARLIVTSETTIAAIQRLHAVEGGHLACLNFASAKNPGGGFLGGSEAQEESLARSSALYPCLLAAPEYYERNRACGTTLYLDLAIWSPAVPFFRDDTGALLDTPVCASVITAPAPNAGAVAKNQPAQLGEVELTLRRRAKFVLSIAATHGVRRLVLGAWGCGVFRNDPRVVANVFADLLRPPAEFSTAFDEVTFAIYDRSREQEVVRIFEEALK